MFYFKKKLLLVVVVLVLLSSLKYVVYRCDCFNLYTKVTQSMPVYVCGTDSDPLLMHLCYVYDNMLLHHKLQMNVFNYKCIM